MDKDLQDFAVIMAVTWLMWAGLLCVSIGLIADSTSELTRSISAGNWIESVSDFGWSVMSFFFLLLTGFMTGVSTISIYALIFK